MKIAYYLKYTTLIGISILLCNVSFTQNGNVGIGTTSPAEKLEINGGNILINSGGSTPGAYSVKSNTYANAQGIPLLQNQASERLLLSSSTGSKGIDFAMGGTPYMVIANNGNVGIGTTNPQGLLNVENGSNTVFKVGTDVVLSGNDVLSGSASGGSAIISGGSNYQGTGAAGPLTLMAGAWGGTDRAKIEIKAVGTGGSGGGIKLSAGFASAASINIDRRTGNGAPAGALTINGGSGESNGNGGSVIIKAGGGTGDVSYRGGDVVLEGGAGIAPSPAGNIILKIGNSEYARISALGKIGIGTASPDAKLHLIGDLKIVDGTQGANKVLTSDANGLASWQTTSYTEIDPVFGASVASGISAADTANWNNKPSISPGTVLQMVIQTTESISSLNVTSFTEVNSDYRISITPKRPNSIFLVEYYFPINTQLGVTTVFHMQLVRNIGGTEVPIGIGPVRGVRSQTTFVSRPNNGTDNNDQQIVYLVAKDANLNTNTTYTYGFKYKREAAGSGTTFFNYSNPDSPNFGFSGVMTMKITEIAQ